MLYISFINCVYHFWFDRRRINWKGVLNLVSYLRARPKGLCHLGMKVLPWRPGTRIPHTQSNRRRTTNSRRKVQIGNDQKMTQLERNSHSINRGVGKN